MARRNPSSQPKVAKPGTVPPNAQRVQDVFAALDKAKRQPIRAVQMVSTPPRTRIDIEQEIAREQKLKNDNAEQDIALKRQTLNRLFLGIETTGVFLLAFCQATHWPAQFHLEEWSFKLLMTATILQITGMLFVAVRYLFPKGK
jgi:hypothetical protein